MTFKFSKLIAGAIVSVGLAVGLAPGSVKAQQGGHFMAQVMPWAGNFAPRGWALCDGQLLPIAQNTALFSLLGTTYGGDGRTTFALPDLRGRSVLHPGTGPGLSSYRLGQKGGAPTVPLALAQIASHDHNPQELKAATVGADGTSPNGAAIAEAAADVFLEEGGTLDATLQNGSVTESTIGGGQAHQNRQPYIAVNWIIATTGTYPSRN